MERVITTLPASPRENPQLGFFLSPFIVHILGRMQGVRTACSINLLGSKNASSSALDTYRDMLSALSITPDEGWIDADLPWEGIVQDILDQGVHRGWLRIGVRSIYACSCGKTEFLYKEKNLMSGNFNRKVYELRGGIPFCLLCGGEAVRRQSETLLIAIPESLAEVVVLPAYASCEWDDLRLNLCGNEILISRLRTTGLFGTVNGKRFNVDVDTAWMLHLHILKLRSIEADTLVCGNKTLKQAFMACAVADLLDTPVPRIVVSLPYLTVNLPKMEEQGAKGLLSRYGREVARTLLLYGIGSTRKEVTIPEGVVALVERSVRTTNEFPLDGPPSSIDPRELWKSFNSQALQQVLAHLRRKHIADLNDLSRRLMSATLL